MTARSLSDCKLWSTIERGKLLTISEDTLIHEIYSAFQPEIDRLKNAVAVERGSPPLIEFNGSRCQTPSEILFDEDYDEVNRSMVGILSFRWLLNNDYAKFTNGQPENTRLKRGSFKWLRERFQTDLQCSEDYFAVILAMIVNDLGKDPQFEQDFLEQTDGSINGGNHDLILHEGARIGMVPCLDYLSDDYRENIMLGLELGSTLNAGQLAQAENVPVNLEGLYVMKGHETAFHLKFMEQILDVAGAAGHRWAFGAKTLIEPVFQAFKTVHDVSISIIQGKCTLREGYDSVLTQRGEMLESLGFRQLKVDRPEERALLRLLTMGRTATLEQAQLYNHAFTSLDFDHKKQLIDGLNIDAIADNETAVVPYYMPAMLAEVLRETRSEQNQVEALAALMRYLSRVLHWNDDEDQQHIHSVREHRSWPLAKDEVNNKVGPHRAGRVFERNMTKARETIHSLEFRQNPAVLDRLPPPAGHLLQRRRTSQSA